MTQLSDHFTVAELSCRCGCGLLPPALFIDQLESLRVRFGKPMTITSGARCPAHNESVSTTGPNGPHVPTKHHCAVDVSIHGPHAFWLVEAAMRTSGWYGIGLRQHGPLGGRIIHLDTHWNSVGIPRPRIWTYPS